jgi:hypothetical protein
LGNPADFLIDDASGEYLETVKLFRLSGLYSGAWDQKNLKISIENIRASANALNPYGSFTVTVRRADDSDNAVRALEKFSGCNLDPTSPGYIARKIGDTETRWDATEQRYVEMGSYPNKSQFIRVQLNPDVDAGLLDPALVPFGFYGPPQLCDIQAAQDTTMFGVGRLLQGGYPATVAARRAACHVGGVQEAFALGTAPDFGFASLDGRNTAQHAGNDGSNDDGGDGDLADSATAHAIYSDTPASVAYFLRMPKLKLRQNSRQGGLSSPKKAYWGIDTSAFNSETNHDDGYGDYLEPLPGLSQADRQTMDNSNIPSEEDFYPSFAFSMDDIQFENAQEGVISAGGNGWVTLNTGTTHAEYLPEDHDGAGDTAANRLARGAASARRMGTSLSAASDFNNTLRRGFDQFTMPLYGGSDGVDIQEKEPFSNTILNAGSAAGGEIAHYAYASVKRAIDACADAEVVECNLMAMPGITEPSLTNHLIKTCEDRADALAIIDLENVSNNQQPGDYIPATEGVQYDEERQRLPNVDNTVQNMEDRMLNSSYGCAYFPWVQIRDEISNRLIWVPPSTVALGTMASSQQAAELWFAPAGFTRGGLTEGAAGLPVTNVRHKLSSKERDKLYEANINPIASFPSEGIVVFGQKTLQMQRSALDRINVRRLLIYLKKEVSRMAATVLFDQNVKVTWSRFIGKVEPFLAGVKSRLGLTEFRVILDETTTTPDLIDRNIMYAKIFLKPARAIEFIAIDFVITNSGASFAD